MKILITSVGTATSVNLIRYLKKYGHKITGVDVNEYGYTAGSMMCDSYYKVPYADSDNFISIVFDVIKKEEIELLIPVNDIEIYTLAGEINEIPCKCLIPGINTINLLRDKYSCSTFLRDKGFDVPEILENDDLAFDRILRDRIGVGSKGIKYINCNQKAPEYDKQNAFLQKCVKGDEYTVDVLCDRSGNPIYIIPRKRLEVKSGVATKVLIENNQCIVNVVKKMLEYIKIPGFSNFQFIKDSFDKLWFIEINYRFSGCGAASLAVSNDYLKHFEDVVNDIEYDGTLNPDTRFNVLVTRYYEEVTYDI